jgi:Cd2+/Zn2+-exporting ATPase
MIITEVSSSEIHLNDSSEFAEAEQRRVLLHFLRTFLGFALVMAAVLSKYILRDTDDSSQLSALLGAILLGAPIVTRAVRELFLGIRHMTELVAIAIIACVSNGMYLEAGIVAFLMQVAELIQTRSALGARQAVEGLVRMAPTEAHLVSEDGKERDVPVKSLTTGQTVRVRPGETICADGEIIRGITSIEEASITGESLPADKGEGAPVFAGTVNLTGAIDVKITRVGDDTTLGQVRDMILNAEQTKIPIMRIIDNYIQWYTPVVLMIAFAIWFFTGVEGMGPTISALIVTCPCAFVLATPTAMVASLSCAARHGMLVKDVKDLEAAGRINAIAFDKTGTLTTGQLAVTHLSPAEGVEPAHMLTLAASAEAHSNHPVAKAVVRVAKEAKLNLPEALDVHEEPGMGVSATVDGAAVRIGRDSWLKSEGVDVDVLAIDPEKTEGFSILVIAEGTKAIGWIGLEDKARDEARSATKELRDLGIRRLTMFTGDRWSVAKRVAAELGCTEVEAECLPGRKLELVQKMKDAGLRVAVVGDGVNDAPALAAGDIGIAMGAAGSDVAIHSASIALMSDDLGRLPFLIRLSRKTRSVVNQNLLFALIFILIGLGFSAGKMLPVVLSAVLHIVGSMIVIFNSARLVRFGEDQRPDDVLHL